MTADLDELRTELDEFAQPKKKDKRSPREERIIAGFEEIQRFVENHGHPPRHGEDNDIFERIYAMRLDRLRALGECRDVLRYLDKQGLLDGEPLPAPEIADKIDDDELLAELRGDSKAPGDITELRHVRTRAEIKAAEEIAGRERCEDFEQFKPLFEKVDREIKSGVRETRRFGRDAAINQGEFFILGGQMVYVAAVGEVYRTPNSEQNARMRVIYSNGTESNLLLRSLQRALYKDDAGRRLTEPNAGPLFSDTWDEEDIESGTIYVLRSKSDHPYVAEHRELIHKIGVTGGKVETRIANAAKDATYLLADVEVVATYKLAGINRTKMENLFHRIFAPAQLDLTIDDRFGNPVRPREWFLLPLHVINDTVEKIRDGSISSFSYDREKARLVES